MTARVYPKPPPCSNGCNRPAHARGICGACYAARLRSEAARRRDREERDLEILRFAEIGTTVRALAAGIGITEDAAYAVLHSRYSAGLLDRDPTVKPHVYRLTAKGERAFAILRGARPDQHDAAGDLAAALGYHKPKGNQRCDFEIGSSPA